MKLLNLTQRQKIVIAAMTMTLLFVTSWVHVSAVQKTKFAPTKKSPSVGLNASDVEILAMPLHTGGTPQTKSGGLIVNASGSADSIALLVPNGRVGIGTLDPPVGLSLQVIGKLAADKLCTTDTNTCLTIGDFKKAIQNKKSLVTPFPPKTIAMFLGQCPSGWQSFNDMNGRFPRGVLPSDKSTLSGWQCPLERISEVRFQGTCYSTCDGQFHTDRSTCEWRYWVHKLLSGTVCEGNIGKKNACTAKTIVTPLVGTTGGSDSHAHSVDARDEYERGGRNYIYVGYNGISGGTNIPPYANVVFCNKPQ